MQVTLRQLQVFDSIVKHLNFTRAAEELHLSQPAVSMQIKQLESSAGIRLYEVQGKKIALTEAGIELSHYSRNINKLLAEAEETLEGLKGGKKGHLALSVASTANYFATSLIAAFKQRYPATTFNLDVNSREILLKQLENNKSDLVIMGLPPSEMTLRKDPFMENPLVVIAPPDHPLLQQKNIPFDQLQEEPFMVREKGSGTDIAVQRYFSEKNINLQTAVEVNSNEAIKHAVEAGLGLGIVSIHTLKLELELKRLGILDVEGFPILRHWYLVYQEGKRLSPVVNLFREFVLNESAALLDLPSIANHS